MIRRALLGLAVVAALVAAAAAPAGAATAPWRAGEEARVALFDAQTALIVGEPGEARAAVARAEAAASGLARRLRGPAPGPARDIDRALAAARAAAGVGDERALAAAAARVRGGILEGSFVAAVGAAGAGRVDDARRWLKLRDFRTATRAYRPRPEATLALRSLAEGELPAADAALLVRKDLLDGYQARMTELMDEAGAAAGAGYATRLAESGVLAARYWAILRAEYGRQRGPQELARADAAVATLERAAAVGAPARAEAALAAVTDRLRGFRAAPLTEEESARRAGQLLRFLELIPVEYDAGTADGRVTVPFEIEEGITFRDAAQEALADLEPQLAGRDPAAVETARASLTELRGYLLAAREGGSAAPQEEVDEATARATVALEAAYPEEWKQEDPGADIDLTELALDRMLSAARAGEWEVAEQARIEAYATFEFGPELRLRAFDPGLARHVEGLIWYGAGDSPGLAKLIADRAEPGEVRANRLALTEALDDVRGTLGDSTSTVGVITNSALIVFREGLEGVLILAAVTASMLGANRRLRAPIMWGAAAALVASVLTWLVAQTVLESLSRYGERLEAVVGLVAIAILLLILNWFFHKVYWTKHISGFHKRRSRLLGAAAVGGVLSAQVVGLTMLGFSSVYREGFETVLFLQALQLSAGTAVVLQGVALGLVATGAVAVLTFAVQRKLPYKRMLIITGVLIGVVLLVMVGKTVRTLQGVGWLPITPLGDLEVPFWAGEWFGAFPTLETVAAQVAAGAFVIGSYFLAEHVRDRRPRRRAARRAGAAPVERTG